MNIISFREYRQASQLPSEAPVGEGKTTSYVVNAKYAEPTLLEIVENSGDCDGYVSECFARRLMSL